MAKKSRQQDFFTTRWGLILSVLGIAIGTGNIWRFPRIAAQNGGPDGAGAFLVAWVVFLFIWSIPLIIAEYAIGRNGRKGTIGSFMVTATDQYAWMGAFVGFVAMAIMFYYSVVNGWCIYYFIESTFQPLPHNVEAAQTIWSAFQGSWMPVFFNAVAIFGAGYVVAHGVKTIERVNTILIPLLALILILSAVRALSLPNSMDGIKYLFTPDWSMLRNPRVWLEALTQNAWDTGAGWGLILTYATYMRKEDAVTISAFQTGIGNNAISLLAAVIIFSTVFGTLSGSMSNPQILEVMKTSGPASTGLTFMWMPLLFTKMTGGRIFAAFFFLALTFAAFSSLISMVELASRLFIDMGFSRVRATFSICTVGFFLGLPSAIDLNIFSNQDFVWGLGLIFSGLFIAFIIIRYGTRIFRERRVNTSPNDWTLGRWWDYVIKFLVPLEGIVLIVWWVYLSATEFDPKGWYNPFDTYSVATCVVQWGVVLLFFILMNKRLAKATTSQVEETLL